MPELLFYKWYKQFMDGREECADAPHARLVSEFSTLQDQLPENSGRWCSEYNIEFEILCTSEDKIFSQRPVFSAMYPTIK